jgi:heme/copper-type cytochrome/quinol oxidase subunit 4
MFPVLSRAARLQALIIAGLAAASVALQWVYLMDLRGTGPLETVLRMARFFTILTMVLVVIAFVTGRQQDAGPERARRLRL